MGIDGSRPIGPFGVLPVDPHGDRQRVEFRVVRLPHARDDDGEQEKEEVKTAFPFNPHSEALGLAEQLERDLKVVSMIENTGTLPLLGGTVDVRV